MLRVEFIDAPGRNLGFGVETEDECGALGELVGSVAGGSSEPVGLGGCGIDENREEEELLNHHTHLSSVLKHLFMRMFGTNYLQYVL